MKRSPFGEARRLRYLQYICNQLSEKKVIDYNIFIDNLMNAIEVLNKNLIKYKRKTGIMRTPAVIRNYIRWCDWLDLIVKEGNILRANNKTIFFSSTNFYQSFYLSDKEKISFFINIINNDKFKTFLKRLNIVNRPKDIISFDLTEHYVETFLEWCIDLGIIEYISSNRGKFVLKKQFINLIELVKRNKNEETIKKEYFSGLINEKVYMADDISKNLIWKMAGFSLNKYSKYTQSDMDKTFFSAFPMLFDVQINLILKYQKYIEFNKLVNLFYIISNENKVLFSWDYIQNDGFIQIKEVT